MERAFVQNALMPNQFPFDYMNIKKGKHITKLCLPFLSIAGL
ncbi:MAG: hypothetical protein K0S80_31 [Neobacillus sp.]|nr:hypothetical protein [Neobacillus sp.]